MLLAFVSPLPRNTPQNRLGLAAFVTREIGRLGGLKPMNGALRFDCVPLRIDQKTQAEAGGSQIVGNDDSRTSIRSVANLDEYAGKVSPTWRPL
jgi:hypothetical protein